MINYYKELSLNDQEFYGGYNYDNMYIYHRILEPIYKGTWIEASFINGCLFEEDTKTLQWQALTKD